MEVEISRDRIVSAKSLHMPIVGNGISQSEEITQQHRSTISRESDLEFRTAISVFHPKDISLEGPYSSLPSCPQGLVPDTTPIAIVTFRAPDKREGIFILPENSSEECDRGQDESEKKAIMAALTRLPISDALRGFVIAE